MLRPIKVGSYQWHWRCACDSIAIWTEGIPLAKYLISPGPGSKTGVICNSCLDEKIGWLRAELLRRKFGITDTARHRA